MSLQYRTLGVELLEPRRLLAGKVTVDVSGGSLEIDGNKLDNTIEIRQIDADSFEITGVGTQVNGAASFIANNVTAGFNISLGSGNDTLRILGALDVPRDLWVRMGNGNDIIAPNNVRVHGNLLFNMGNGNDQIRVVDSFFEGRAEFWSKHGDDLARIENTTVHDFFEFDMGEDNDTVEVIMSTFEGTSQIDSSDGQDAIHFSGSTFKGVHNFISKGPGPRSYDISNSTFRGDTTFRSGVGDESVNTSGSTFEAKLSGQFDAGSDRVELRNSIFRDTVALDGADGNDTAIAMAAGNTFPAGQPNLQNFEDVS